MVMIQRTIKAPQRKLSSLALDLGMLLSQVRVPQGSLRVWVQGLGFGVAIANTKTVMTVLLAVAEDHA